MKKRLDVLIVERGYAPSREKAQALVMAGEVRVDGHVALKAGQTIEADADLEVGAGKNPFVSRGGLKLDAALGHFLCAVEGRVALDIGSSTGGFTDCLLQRGAHRVYAVDVGHGLIDQRLRSDTRVVLLERTNFRYLERNAIPDCIDIAVIDVSFISVTKIIPRMLEFLCGTASVLVLVKPQFEVGRGQVGKGGIVRDEGKRLAAVAAVEEHMAGLGLTVHGRFESPVRGQKGNVEYFVHAAKG